MIPSAGGGLSAPMAVWPAGIEALTLPEDTSIAQPVLFGAAQVT